MKRKDIKGDLREYVTTLKMKEMLPKGYDTSCLQKYKLMGSRKTYYSLADIQAILDDLTSSKMNDIAITEDLTIIAYVDGSFNKETKVYGSGIVLLEGDNVITTKQTHGTKMNAIWNVAGEISAAAGAVKLAEEFMPDHLIIRYDYEGIEKWATGQWKAKNDFTAKYAEFMNKKRDFDISYEHVKAHTGDKYNEMADDLALEAAGVKKMQERVPEYNKTDDKIPEDMLRIKYQVCTTCLEGIKAFYSLDKHAFKDYAKLRTGQSDNFSKMYTKEEFEPILSAEAMAYILTCLDNKNDALNAMRWTARGLNADDAVRKANVDKELYQNR